MVTAVVILVAAAAFQGIYNLLKEAHHEFELVDPADLVKEQTKPEGAAVVEPFERRAA